MLRRCFPSVIFVLASALFFPAIVLACAVCVSGGGANDPLNDAFNWSVLFLMATPYTVVGSVAGWLVYTHWRAAAKKNGGLRKKTPFLSLAWIHKGVEDE